MANSIAIYVELQIKTAELKMAVRHGLLAILRVRQRWVIGMSCIFLVKK